MLYDNLWEVAAWADWSPMTDEYHVLAAGALVGAAVLIWNKIRIGDRMRTIETQLKKMEKDIDALRIQESQRMMLEVKANSKAEVGVAKLTTSPAATLDQPESASFSPLLEWERQRLRSRWKRITVSETIAAAVLAVALVGGYVLFTLIPGTAVVAVKQDDDTSTAVAAVKKDGDTSAAVAAFKEDNNTSIGVAAVKKDDDTSAAIAAVKEDSSTSIGVAAAKEDNNTSTGGAAVKKDKDDNAGGPTETAAVQLSVPTNTTGRDGPLDGYKGAEVPAGAIAPGAPATNSGDAEVIANHGRALRLPSNEPNFNRERAIVSLPERGKQLPAVSGLDSSCLPSASAVRQNHPGGWPSWTLRAPGHEGTRCWYAATRDTPHDNRSETRRKEAVPTTEEVKSPFVLFGVR